jgi:hypothetical protein
VASTTSPTPDLAREFVAQLGLDLQDESCPEEVHSLGRTLRRWLDQITAWHQAKVTNGPTEAINNLIKRIKRIGFGFRRLRNYRVRALLYAGVEQTRIRWCVNRRKPNPMHTQPRGL